MESTVATIPILGSLANSGAILAGGFLGVLLRSRFPERLSTIAFQVMGLFSLSLGVSMASKSANSLVLIFIIVAGAMAGELLRLEDHTDRMATKLKQRFAAHDEGFSQAFMTTFLLFAMGSMGILGAIEEGLGKGPHLLYIKAMLDGAASMILAATLGPGVLVAALPLGVYQGSIALLAGQLAGVLTPPVVNEISAVGGLMIMGIGLSLMGVLKIKTMNLMPSIVVAAILGYAFWPS